MSRLRFLHNVECVILRVPANLIHLLLNYFERRGCGEGTRSCLAVLLLVLSLAPAGSRHHRTTPVWINPCKSDVPQVWRGRGRNPEMEEVEVGGRHRPSPKPLRRLRLQTAITKSHFFSYSDLQSLLCNKVKVPDNEVNYSWLPQNPSQWYKKKVKCLDKKGKVMMVLPTLHEGLQRYSASLERLKESPGNQLTTECRNRRRKLFDEISGKVNQLLCELDKCMRDLKIWRGPGLREKEGRTLVPVAHDVTSAHLIEATVLSAYASFIKDWNRIIRQVVGPKGNRTCTHK